jgi:hypothetical protein
MSDTATGTIITPCGHIYNITTTQTMEGFTHINMFHCSWTKIQYKDKENVHSMLYCSQICFINILEPSFFTPFFSSQEKVAVVLYWYLSFIWRGLQPNSSREFVNSILCLDNCSFMIQPGHYNIIKSAV